MSSPDRRLLSGSSDLTTPITMLDELDDALFVQAQWARGLTFHRSGQVPGAVSDPMALLGPDASLLLDQQLPHGRRLVAEVGNLVVKVSVAHGVTAVGAAGAELSSVEAFVEDVIARATELVEVPEGSVRMRFWSYREQFANESTRRVTAPTWPDSARNYPIRTRRALADLMGIEDVSHRSGRLVLWHGAPGTGKATAVRALSREWAAWCEPQYVMDPERLFSEPQYLLEVSGADEDEDDDGRWRLVVAEDCDEYLRSDAKQRSGASLGRLLNLCDGILGHGLRVLVLLTTNEDLGGLHPAITRPGRCLARVEFDEFSPQESESWLDGAAPAPERPATLAELYALAEHRPAVTAERAAPGGYL